MNDDSLVDPERPSKSELKRRSDDLQALGESLISLPIPELQGMDLPDALLEAVLTAKRITAHGGLYRQKQYIGKLMRKIDPTPIQAALQAREDAQRQEARRFHRLELWRERLLREGTPAVQALAAEVPDIDTAAITRLIEQARHEQQVAQRSTHAARALFRMLREAL